MPSELRKFHTYKTLIIENVELPSVVNERLGGTDVGIVCSSHVVFHYHHMSFNLVCILVHLFIIGYAMSKLFVLIEVNNSLSLFCD